MFYKIVLLVSIGTCYGLVSHNMQNEQTQKKVSESMHQFDDGDTTQNLKNQSFRESNLYTLGWCVVGLLGVIMFLPDVKKCKSWFVILFCLIMFNGCRRPFEPIKLETINTNEEAFLLPFQGDLKEQASTKTEEYLRENLVHVRQIKIPQQWVQLGYETMFPNGEWKDAALLVKIDKSPVTREWTADPNSGTSNKNEAIFVMSSDGVEWSTGWTCTARIASKDDAVKFLYNYPSGSLSTVMDTEVRAKIQSIFGLEVTDLMMEEMRKAATPHIEKTVNEVKEFFQERGITITNLGITGGFIYKDKSIMDMLVKVFNSEQEKNIAKASTEAQEEKNKKVILEAQGKADALLKERKAEAEGIKLVADTKLYEIEQAKSDSETYMMLKRLELQKEMLEKWDGSYPKYFMGNENPSTLLQLPAMSEKNE